MAAHTIIAIRLHPNEYWREIKATLVTDAELEEAQKNKYKAVAVGRNESSTVDAVKLPNIQTPIAAVRTRTGKVWTIDNGFIN